MRMISPGRYSNIQLLLAVGDCEPRIHGNEMVPSWVFVYFVRNCCAYSHIIRVLICCFGMNAVGFRSQFSGLEIGSACSAVNDVIYRSIIVD